MKKKIEFDPRYREAIESGKYKVKTLDGDDVRIVCWDADETPHPIIGLVTLEGDSGVTAIKYNGNGEPGPQWNRNLLAIIIETDEEELTDFEKGVVDMLWEVDHDYDVEAREGYYEEMVRKYGEKLKELAYKEICQNANKNEFPGKVIYDKGFEAGRKITEDQRNEIWESGNDFGYDEGKKDALLELPKWIWEPRMDSNGDDVHDAFIVKRGNHYDDDLYYEGYIINVAQLFNKLRKIGRE